MYRMKRKNKDIQLSSSKKLKLSDNKQLSDITKVPKAENSCGIMKKLKKRKKQVKSNILQSVEKKFISEGKRDVINRDDQKLLVSAKLPQKPAEFSSNWKNLQKTVGLNKKKSCAHANNHKTTGNKPKEESKIWFDGVDDIYLENSSSTLPKTNTLVKKKSFNGLTNTIAMDCEMVGVGIDGNDSILARVSLVNQFGKCVYDKFVKATEIVTDYRTHVSGVRQKDMENGENFKTVQKEVSEMLNGRILVGHALHNDLKILYLNHPRKKIRDTQQYKPFQTLFSGRKPSLKNLTAKVLAIEVQTGEHSSVQDAQAAMRLYTMYKAKWEKELSEKFKHRSSKKGKHKKKQKKEQIQKGISNMMESDSD